MILPIMSSRYTRTSSHGIHDCDGWLITGSKHGVYEDHVWFRWRFCAGLMRRNCSTGSVLGIRLWQALGGRVEKPGAAGPWGVANGLSVSGC